MSADKVVTGDPWGPAACAIAFLTLPWWSWVGATIWRWHVVPLGLPPLSMGAVLGVMCLKSLLLAKPPRKGEPEIHWQNAIVVDVFGPPFLLLVAWLARFLP